jgi:TPR repeat protein
VQALKWYRKAAEQGHAEALFNLGGRYYNGEGVTKDEIEAYAYWNLIRTTDEDARRNLAVFEKEMSAGQIAAGQKRSKELQKELATKKAKK